MDCSLPGSSVHGFSRQEYWSGVPLPSPLAVKGEAKDFPGSAGSCLPSAQNNPMLKWHILGCHNLLPIMVILIISSASWVITFCRSKDLSFSLEIWPDVSVPLECTHQLLHPSFVLPSSSYQNVHDFSHSSHFVRYLLFWQCAQIFQFGKVVKVSLTCSTLNLLVHVKWSLLYRYVTYGKLDSL